MIKIENVVTPSPEQWEAIIMGTRNPMNSWDRSDSGIGCSVDFVDRICTECDRPTPCVMKQKVILGPNDHDLMMRLAKGGPVHAKYRRMITVYATITAPLYWWKEMDTYQIGVVKNSCSTMHKIAAKEFTLEDFSHEHLIDREDTYIYSGTCEEFIGPKETLEVIIDMLNESRREYLETKDKKYWWQMIQLLPTSYNQRRTVMLNYEVLANIYKSRRNHKLDEWHVLCDWIRSLPYAELITGKSAAEESYEKGQALMEGMKKVIDPTERASEAYRAMKDIMDKINDLKKELGVVSPSEHFDDSIDHLVDVTCSWHEEVIHNGDRLYAIGPGFTREDLTPYELQLLKKSEEYEKKNKE